MLDGGHEVRVLRHALNQDGPGAGKRCGGVIYGMRAVHVLRGLPFGVQVGPLQQRLRERLQPGLPGNLCLGPALGLERQVDVFKP